MEHRNAGGQRIQDDRSGGLFASRVGGQGVIIKDGKLIYQRGNNSTRNIASASKPMLSTMLLYAIEKGLMTSPDQSISSFWLDGSGNPMLREADRAVTFRMLANMTSGYGTLDAPGTTLSYNDGDRAAAQTPRRGLAQIARERRCVGHRTSAHRDSGVECCSGGVDGKFTLVFTFEKTPLDGLVTVESGTAQIAGAPVAEGNTLRVELTGVSDAQKVVLNLSSVVNASGGVSAADQMLVQRAIGGTVAP